MPFLIRLLLSIVICFLPQSAFAEEEKAPLTGSHSGAWTGTYVPIQHSGSYIKKLELIAAGKDGIKARVWVEVGKIGEGIGPFEFSIESEARQYNDCNSKASDNCLIANFPQSKYKPLIIFNRSSLSALRSSKRYDSISYRCYLQGYSGDCSTKGRLDREEPDS